MVICITITCFVCILCCCYKCRKVPNLEGYFNTRDDPYTKMAIIKGCLKQIVWIIVRFLFLLFRTIIWLILMRYCKIWDNRRNTSYKNTAHVQKILFRHKIDHMIQPASSANFLTMHSSFRDPEYVLAKNITLYCITKREAFFVECDPNIDVTNSDTSSFLRIAQFKHAKNMIVLPMHIFHKLGHKVGEFPGKLVFLTNTGRCGSTLLTQVFEETHECVSMSEPDAINTLTMLHGKITEEAFDQLVKVTIDMLCKNYDQRIKSYVLKLSQPNLPLVPYLARLYPESRHLFMYRDGIYVARSVAKVIRGTPLTGFLTTLARNCLCMKLGRILSKAAGLPIKDYDQFETLHNPFQIGTIMWAASMRQYLDFVNSGIDIAAVRYEDMISDTDYALQQIFNFCKIPFRKDAVDRAFSRDSQRGSPISKEKLGQFDHLDITDKIRHLTDYSCEVFQVPSIYKTYIAKNTISYRSISHGSLQGDDISIIIDSELDDTSQGHGSNTVVNNECDNSTIDGRTSAGEGDNVIVECVDVISNGNMNKSDGPGQCGNEVDRLKVYTKVEMVNETRNEVTDVLNV